MLKTPHGHLTEAGAKKVRELREQGLSYAKIAEQIGISQVSVYNICKGNTWTWLVENG